MVRQRELRIEAGVGKARRVINAMELPDIWSSTEDSWRVKQWIAAAELHCTAEQLRTELATVYAEACSAVPASRDVMRFKTLSTEELEARKHCEQAGELAFALMHFGEAQGYLESAARLAAEEGAHAQALHWQEETADVFAAIGQNATELDRRAKIEEQRHKFLLPDPAPGLTAAKTALCWRRGGKPQTGYSNLNNFLKAYPVHLDAAHPEALFVLGTHTMLLWGQGTEYLGEVEAETRGTLSECEQVYGKDSPQTAIAAVHLARFLATVGRPADAKSALDQAKSLCEKNFGPEHPLTTVVLLNQALAVFKSGDVEGARKSLEHVLEADEKCFRPDSVETAGVLFHLGVAAAKGARLADSERYLRGSMDMAERAAGSNFPLAVSARAALARVEDLLGKNSDAQSNTPEVRLEAAAGHPENPAVLVARLAAAGELQLQTGKYQESERTLRQAVDVAKKNPQNPECNGVGMALALRNLGRCLAYSQQWIEAEADLKEALAIEEKVKGPDHPDLAVTLTCLTEVLVGENRPTEAERLLERALKLCNPGTGPMTSETLYTLSVVGRNLSRFKRFTEALPIQRLVVENSRTNYGRESMLYGTALYDFGKTEMLLGHLDEAENAFEEAVPIGEKLTQGNMNVVEWQAELASCYASQHKLAQAEPLFRKSVQGLLHAAKETGKDPATLGSLLGLYAHHLQAMGLTREQIAKRIDHLRQGESVPDL